MPVTPGIWEEFLSQTFRLKAAVSNQQGNKMNMHDLLIQARSCRRFTGDPLSPELLASLVDCARISASVRNEQVLRFATVSAPAECEHMNALVVLGGVLKPEQRAQPHQHPRGFIVILGPEKKSDFTLMDVGIAAQSMHLAAADAGLSSCMIGAFKKSEVTALLNVPQGLEVYLVMALGRADEEQRLVDPREDGSLTYYRDSNDVHCVPKRKLEDVLIIRR